MNKRVCDHIEWRIIQRQDGMEEEVPYSDSFIFSGVCIKCGITKKELIKAEKQGRKK